MAEIHRGRPRKARFGLLGRIALALAVVGLVPILAVSLPLVRINREAMSDRILQTHLVAARATADRVGSSLASLAAVADAVAGNPEVLRDPRSPAVRELMAGLLQARGDLIALVLESENDGEILRVQRRGRGGDVDLALALDASGGPVASRFESGLCVVLERDLAGAGGRLLSVVDGAAVTGVLDVPELGGESDLVLVAASGQILAGSRSELSAFPPALLEAGSSRRLAGSGEFSFADGRQILGAYAPVELSDWVVLSQQPAAVAAAIEGRMVRESLIAVALALSLTGLLSALAYTTVVRPIRRLARAQRQLAGRTGDGGGGDEIEQLQTSFELIQRRVRDQEDLGRVFLGRYQVVELLGEGAMGTVFRGWDPKLERTVALKTMRLGQEVLESRQRQNTAALRREAIAGARIHHPNIVAVYDIVEAPEVAFIAMEFVEGFGLERLLLLRGALAPPPAVALCLAVARALAALHEGGVVHRDVKPSNVLLGLAGEIKVTDFGISEFVSALADSVDTIFGTPGYVPPEALKGQGFDERGDLFGFGVLLYESLTGRQPFAAAKLKDSVMRTLKLTPDPVVSIRPDVPVGLSELVESLLAKAPAARPASAAEVVERLEGFAVEVGAHWDSEVLQPLKSVDTPVRHLRSQVLNTRELVNTERMES